MEYWVATAYTLGRQVHNRNTGIIAALLFVIYGLTKWSKYAYVILWLLASWAFYYAAGRLGAYLLRKR